MNLIRAGVIWKSNCTCPSAKAATGKGSQEAAGSSSPQQQAGEVGGSAPWDPSPHREVGGPRCCKVSLPCYSPQPFSQRGFTQTGTDNGSHGSKRCCKSERSSLAEALPTFAGSTERCQEGNAGCPQHAHPCWVCRGAALIPHPQEKSIAFSVLPTLI